MKKIFPKIALCTLGLLIFLPGSRAQQEVQGLKQKFDITINDKGDADIEVSMKLNAAQWDLFKRTTGNNTSIIKREIEKALPKFYLTDFGYSEDQMERTYKVKLKALGLCMLNNSGRWEAKLETKNPDITKLSDKEFIMNEDIMVNGTLVQQTQKLHLCSGATDAKVEKDSFGSAVLTYSTGMGWGNKLITYGGIVLILAGGWSLYKNFSA